MSGSALCSAVKHKRVLPQTETLSDRSNLQHKLVPPSNDLIEHLSPPPTFPTSHHTCQRSHLLSQPNLSTIKLKAPHPPSGRIFPDQ